jgi:hypothetical protein
MKNEYQLRQDEIKSDFNQILHIYFQEFFNKFDNFNNQLKIADLVLKAYKERYDKMKSKWNNNDDALMEKIEEQKALYKKLEKLDLVEAKLTTVEVKLYLLNKKVSTLDERIGEKLKKSSLQSNENNENIDTNQSYENINEEK